MSSWSRPSRPIVPSFVGRLGYDAADGRRGDFLAWRSACRARWRASPASARRIAGTSVETVRNAPFIVQIVFIFFGLSSVELRLPILAASAFALVTNIGADTAEILRAEMEAVPSRLRPPRLCPVALSDLPRHHLDARE